MLDIELSLSHVFCQNLIQGRSTGKSQNRNAAEANPDGARKIAVTFRVRRIEHRKGNYSLRECAASNSSYGAHRPQIHQIKTLCQFPQVRISLVSEIENEVAPK